ncbi:MAG TPA: hypothetical protein VLA46_01010 [Saprospiraceae bacterium]|nr:hypothetical protein [Saprospiraceae bacterium]
MMKVFYSGIQIQCQGVLAIALLFCACASPGAKAPEPCSPPAGKFVNVTVLDKCPDKMPVDVPHFCLELNFWDNDSVLVDNGFEKFSLPFSLAADGCTFKITGASLFGDMYFIFSGDSSIQLIDTAWTKLEDFSSFKKVKPIEGEDVSFEYFLNECILTGEYALFENGNLASHQVTIMPNGQLNGLKPFLAYSLCYAGDCLEETEPPSRTIILIDEKGEKQTFAFKSIEGKMALELYRIGPPIPDMKGGRSIGPMVYELRTE